MTTGCEFMLSFGSSQPTSDNPRSPGFLCLRTPPRPWPAQGPEAPSSHTPLEPTPPFLSGEGILGPLPRTKRGLPRPLYPRGLASQAGPPTASLSGAPSLGLLPPALTHTTILRGFKPHRPQAPAAGALAFPRSQGLIGAQAGVVDVHGVPSCVGVHSLPRTRLGGFLPSSSLSPGALVGEVGSLSPMQTGGGLWTPPRSPLWPGDAPPLGLSPEGRDVFSSFPSQSKQR